LGAQIVSPAADVNLGIHAFVDGLATDPVAIDTTIPGTHSIDYVATGHFGFTATSTRTVIVSAPANDNAPEATSSTPTSASTPAFTPAANDNSATTSAATSPGTTGN
jgi:hypothetical protein